MTEIWQGFTEAVNWMFLPFAVTFGAVTLVTLDGVLALWLAAVEAVLALVLAATEREEDGS